MGINMLLICSSLTCVCVFVGAAAEGTAVFTGEEARAVEGRGGHCQGKCGKAQAEPGGGAEAGRRGRTPSAATH